MKHILYKRYVLAAAFIVITAFWVVPSYSEETVAEPVAPAVLWAKPVNQATGLGKFLGKTMKAVSHNGASIFPKFPNSKKEHADKGAPEKQFGLFDPQRNESPIRTARLFKIQINPPVATPVAEPVN